MRLLVCTNLGKAPERIAVVWLVPQHWKFVTKPIFCFTSVIPDFYNPIEIEHGIADHEVLLCISSVSIEREGSPCLFGRRNLPVENPVVSRRESKIAFWYGDWNGIARPTILRNSELVVAPRHDAKEAIYDRDCAWATASR